MTPAPEKGQPAGNLSNLASAGFGKDLPELPQKAP